MRSCPDVFAQTDTTHVTVIDKLSQDSTVGEGHAILGPQDVPTPVEYEDPPDPTPVDTPSGHPVSLVPPADSAAVDKSLNEATEKSLRLDVSGDSTASGSSAGADSAGADVRMHSTASGSSVGADVRMDSGAGADVRMDGSSSDGADVRMDSLGSLGARREESGQGSKDDPLRDLEDEEGGVVDVGGDVPKPQFVTRVIILPSRKDVM